MKNSQYFSLGRSVATWTFLVFACLFGRNWGFLCSAVFVLLSAVQKSLSCLRKDQRFDWIDFLVFCLGGGEFWIALWLILQTSGVI